MCPKHFKNYVKKKRVTMIKSKFNLIKAAIIDIFFY